MRRSRALASTFLTCISIHAARSAHFAWYLCNRVIALELQRRPAPRLHTDLEGSGKGNHLWLAQQQTLTQTMVDCGRKGLPSHLSGTYSGLLIYLSLWHRAPKTLELPKWECSKGVFCYVNNITKDGCGNAPKDGGAGFKGSQPGD